jgi:hypothetical protein
VQASVQCSSGGRCVASAHPARHGQGGAPQGSGRGWWREAGGSAGGAAFIRCAACCFGNTARADATPCARRTEKRCSPQLDTHARMRHRPSAERRRQHLECPSACAQDAAQPRPRLGLALPS